MRMDGERSSVNSGPGSCAVIANDDAVGDAPAAEAAPALGLALGLAVPEGPGMAAVEDTGVDADVLSRRMYCRRFSALVDLLLLLLLFSPAATMTLPLPPPPPPPPPPSPASSRFSEELAEEVEGKGKKARLAGSADASRAADAVRGEDSAA